MLFFTTQQTISSIARQTYTGDKSSYASVGNATCYLRPLTEEQAAQNGVQWGNGFTMIVECAVDIREGDKVTISSTEYTVRGVVNHNRGGFTAYKRVLLLKPQA